MSRRRLLPAVVLALLCSAAAASANPGAPDIVVDTPVFMFSGDPGGSFECQVDSGGWTACESPFDSGATTEGDHLFEVRQIDDANNVGAVGWFSWSVAPADDTPASDDGTSADTSQPLDTGGPLDSSQPFDGGGPLGTAGPLSPTGPDAVSGQKGNGAVSRPAHATRVATRFGAVNPAGFVPFACALRGAPVGRCEVHLVRRAGGVLSVFSAAGHGATLGGPGVHSATVLVALTPAARRALRRGASLRVTAHVTVWPYGGGRPLTVTRRAVLR